MSEAQPALPARPIGSLRLILPFLYPYRLRIAIATTMLVLAVGFMLAVGQGARTIVDHGISSGRAGLDQAVAEMAVIIVGLAAVTAVRFYFVSWLGERVTADLRRAVFDHLVSLPPAFFETARTGDLLSRLAADTAVLQNVIGSSVSLWTRSLLTLIGGLVMLTVTSFNLALYVLLAVPFVVAPILMFGRREQKLSRTAQDRLADTAAYAEEAVNAIRTVQAFNHETIDRTRYGNAVENSVRAALRRILNRSILMAVVIMLGLGAITLGVWAGGRAVLDGSFSTGSLAAFLFYAVIIATSGGTVTELWGELKRAAGAAERLIELLRIEPEITAAPNPVVLPEPPQGRLAFETVTFTYPARPDQAALHGLDFSVLPGETVALVGPSGAGKTTVFQLLLRFYDPQMGRVTIDGVDLRAATPQAIRARVGIVPQDPVIFGGTGWDNIRYGRPDASDDEVRAAADAASASEFLDRLPEGFGTFLGEKGVRLSGGQRQRIAIARAILKDAPILLLDEATSALDAASEQAVQRALANLARDRTTLVIAHRLATVRKADRILVLDHGRVVATGTHDSLVRAGGLYAELASLQFIDSAA